MTYDSWSPKSIMKNFIRTKRKQLSENKTALKGFLMSLVFYPGCSVFFSSNVGMTFISAGLLNILADVTLASVGHRTKS